MSDVDDDMNGDGALEGAESLAQRRTRRTRGDKGGRLAALEKLQSLRGKKNKYECKEVENVYDEVDEDEYERKVNDRLKDDWIVDDGSGYCETGHELFDDDLVDEDGYGRGRDGRKSKNKKNIKLSKDEKESQKSNFKSVRDMLSCMPVKRKRAEEETAPSSTDDDNLLGDLMQELHGEKKAKTSLTGGRNLLERTKAAEKFVSAGKISEENPFSKIPKVPAKKKFEAFKVKQEPIDIEDDSISMLQDDHRSFYNTDHTDETKPAELSASEIIEDFSDEMMAAAEDMEAEAVKVASTSSKPKPVVNDTKPVAPKQEFQLLEVENFETYRQVGADNKLPSEVTVEETSKVEFMTEGETDAAKLMNFYWFDIYEEPKNPGFLYLFGKVKGPSNHFLSCCVILKNVHRCMYLLPKEETDNQKATTFLDVYNEFTEVVALRHKIMQYKVRKVEKKYCFGEKDVPSLSEYLELRYPGTIPPLPEDLSGKSFSKVFGASASMLENLLLEKKLKGPSWLQIKNPVQVESSQQQSWCKMEFTCEVSDMTIHPEKDKLPMPPFTVASLNISTINDASTKRDTIISVSVAINKSFNIQTSISSQGFFHDSFCLLNKPAGEVWPFDIDRHLDKFTTKMDSERAMLACLLAKLQLYDPDVYIGHDLNLDLLLLQLWNHKVPHWSRIGRLKRSSQPQKGGKLPDSKSAVAGRLVCDVKVSAMELIRARSYDLPSLSVQVLGMTEDQVVSYTGGELRQLYESSQGIKHLTQWGMSLSLLNMRLVNELQVMPLALQITTIAGNTLSRTLMGGRSERNEFLLLHAFHSKEYIVPDKSRTGRRFKREQDEEEQTVTGDKGQDKKSSGPSYAGGLVLDPKKGFYDNFIVLMDFNSLYPSIIQEFNICFTTTTTEENTDEGERGILPEEIRKLVQSRRQVKQLMKENVSQELMRQYDIRQKALKLTANSMYGCLGFKNSRFYAQHLAALITGKGRDILLRTKDAVEKLGFEVIYGDTDSLMINTNTQEIQKVYQIGNKIKLEINRMYKLLELEIDGVFRFLLLLKKKKYAAQLYNVKKNGEIETTMELKGLDIVRRDWAPVAASTARAILDEIMTEQQLDDKIFKIVKILNDKAEELRAGLVPLKELLITKQLAKNPEEYKDRQGLYHVQVAKKMNASGNLPKKFKNGDTVPYLFCTDGLPHHPAELMASKVKVKKEEVKTNDEKENGDTTSVKSEEVVLEPDPNYYLSQQVHPVVSRICEPIPGLDGARIAEALSLDPSSYKKRRVVEDSSEDKFLAEVSEAEKYRDCARFYIRCPFPDCRREILFESPFCEVAGKITYTLANCPGCAKPLYNSVPNIINRLTLFMRKFIEKYYEGWYMCEDPGCPNRERTVSLRLERGYLVCPCKQGVMVREYTDSDLNKQLNYLLYVFDMDKRLEELSLLEKGNLIDSDSLKKEITGVLHQLTTVVESQLSRSSYSVIKLIDLFSDLMPVKGFSFDKKKGNVAAAESISN